MRDDDDEDGKRRRKALLKAWHKAAEDLKSGPRDIIAVATMIVANVIIVFAADHEQALEGLSILDENVRGCIDDRFKKEMH